MAIHDAAMYRVDSPLFRYVLLNLAIYCDRCDLLQSLRSQSQSYSHSKSQEGLQAIASQKVLVDIPHNFSQKKTWEFLKYTGTFYLLTVNIIISVNLKASYYQEAKEEKKKGARSDRLTVMVSYYLCFPLVWSSFVLFPFPWISRFIWMVNYRSYLFFIESVTLIGASEAVNGTVTTEDEDSDGGHLGNTHPRASRAMS